MYYKPETKTKLNGHSEIRTNLKEVSLPATLTDDLLLEFGIFPLLLVEPTYDPITQGVRETTPVQVNGNWQQAWETYALDAETIASNQAKAKADLVAQYDSALAKHLDTVAQAKRYDNRITCALRAGYPGPFQAEGQAFAAWMDTCNALAYQWWYEVEAGTKSMFTSTEEFISALPTMVWPV